ncbi:MAG: Arm DNA-binding domain-containing protein [Petrimonas sp.]|uniref:Arm DNA-binding domain-containing protein n=1 Tax=Petrimonas sp. TaxID=2023866 RepID=UPI0026C14FF0|nr:Arm DNA-binding domain-containing protein [Petrimonas sp.]MEA4980515.1 Arm DNA-binding domain-containing protein [Petrimonas sp.]MEA5043419.1 Arm DNA-binding domain-containing protein [Petrimonas sp.]MEA5062030.1 Arm DNA-binding domain-containing protein [Petrimonas sp.]
MKRQTFRVLFFVRRTKTVKSGETPIMLRISIEGQLAELQLKRTIKPVLWNQSKERCTGKDAASLEINRYLESVKLRLLDIHQTMEQEGKLINPMEIKRKFLGLDEEHNTLFQIFQQHNDKCRELIGKDYAKVYGGNYSFYKGQKEIEEQALAQQISSEEALAFSSKEGTRSSRTSR